MEKKAESEKTAETKSKKPLWKRIVKGLLWFLGCTLVLVLVAVLTLPLWINPVATSLAKSLVPDYTGTAFNIERVDLNPYTGKLLISGVELANPEGYSEKDAFALGSLSVDVEVSSLLSKTIHVRDITIDSPSASYVFDAGGVNNIDRIIEAVNKKLGPKEEKEEEPGETKVVIDKVTVKNVKVAVGNGRFELASLVLTDFGKDDAPARLVISGVQLVNPPGFAAENAFSLSSLSIGVETGDLGKLPIKIHDIVIDSPYASYVFDEKNVDNFTRMLEPLLAKGGTTEEKPKDAGTAKKDEKETAESAGSPVTLDRLEVRNLKSHVCNGRFELASLVVTDFGKPTAAMVKLEDVKLVNPDGFAEPNAFSLKSLSIGMETADLSKKPMVFHDIIVDSPCAGVFINGDWDLNFKVLFKPLMGDEKKDEKEEKVAADEKKDEDASHVVIDKLDISGTKIQFDSPIPILKGSIPIPLPTFTDIGKDSKDGATVKEVGDKVLAKVTELAGPLGSSLDAIVRDPSMNMKELFNVDAVKKLGEAKDFLAAGATNVLGGAKDFISGGATNVLGGAKDFISGGTTNVLGGAKDKLSNAVGSTKDFIGGLLPGGDKKDDGKKDDEKREEKK